MSKKTTAPETTSTIVNGIEFTPKMVEELTRLAMLEKTSKNDKKEIDSIKAVYRPFIKDNETTLRDDWMRIGNLRVKVEITRQLKVEIVD